jgi:hypothetical protein
LGEPVFFSNDQIPHCRSAPRHFSAATPRRECLNDDACAQLKLFFAEHANLQAIAEAMGLTDVKQLHIPASCANFLVDVACLLNFYFDGIAFEARRDRPALGVHLTQELTKLADACQFIAELHRDQRDDILSLCWAGIADMSDRATDVQRIGDLLMLSASAAPLLRVIQHHQNTARNAIELEEIAGSKQGETEKFRFVQNVLHICRQFFINEPFTLFSLLQDISGLADDVYREYAVQAQNELEKKYNERITTFNDFVSELTKQ